MIFPYAVKVAPEPAAKETLFLTVKSPFDHMPPAMTQSPEVWVLPEYFEEQELLFKGQTLHSPPV